MAYNNGFPVNYPYYQPFQPAYQQQYQAQYQAQSPQTMTPPTVHAEIIQVDNEQAAINYPVAAGVSQMMILKDESAIYIKTAYANGQANLDTYEKRPKTPLSASPDLSQYVTREELEKRLTAALNAEKQGKKVDSE